MSGTCPSSIDLEWRRRAERVVAGVASTGSKRPSTMFGAEHADAPSHYVDASGCRVTTPGGRVFVDCTMALGAVAFGYADAAVTERAIRYVGRGVTGLTHGLEVEIAERLCATITCAERVLFLKSGAESVAAAVRLARTVTGRTHVIASGYFGWMDWCSDALGVPECAQRDVTRVPWGDVDALAAAIDTVGTDLAAIVVEPVVEREPSSAWLTTARALADRMSAVLVFDEIKTGFRLHRGGYQALCHVTPDLATFGKALANGFPLAAVVGRVPIMDAVHRTWISSTLASEAVALGAASAVLDRHDDEDVCARLRDVGARMRAVVHDALIASRIEGVELLGLDAMWFLRWDRPERESRFLSVARDESVLFKRGAYNYAALAHDAAAIDALGTAAAAAFSAVRDSDLTRA